MGRHSSAPAHPDSPDAPGPSRLERLASRLVLALAGGATTALAVAWAGNTWTAAWSAGVVAGVVVLAASWLASTVPPPPRPEPEQDTSRAGPADDARDPAGRDAVQ